MTATGVILSLVCNAKEGYKDPKKFAEKYVREDIEQRYPGAIYNPILQYRGFELVNVRSSAFVQAGWDISQVGEYGDMVYAYTIQNLWGSTYKTIGAKVFYTSKKAKYKVFKYTVDVDGKSCALSVKVTTAGKAVATLTYDTGKKGKTVYYKPTCSTVVLQNTTPDDYYKMKYFQGSVDLYFAPSAGNNFPGYADHVTVQP